MAGPVAVPGPQQARARRGRDGRKHIVLSRKTYAPPVAKPQKPSLRDRLLGVVQFRLPVGVLAVGAVCLLGAVLMVYLIGTAQGVRQGRQATMERLRETGVLDPGFTLPPPVERDALSTQASPPGVTLTAGTAQGIPGDRRAVGRNYLVLAQYNKTEALRLIQFLRDRGLEAQMIPVHNGALYRVIELTGFDAPSLRTSAYQDHKHKLRMIGREWKSRHRGPSDLSDMWPQRYDG